MYDCKRNGEMKGANRVDLLVFGKQTTVYCFTSCRCEEITSTNNVGYNSSILNNQLLFNTHILVMALPSASVRNVIEVVEIGMSFSGSRALTSTVCSESGVRPVCACAIHSVSNNSHYDQPLVFNTLLSALEHTASHRYLLSQRNFAFLIKLKFKNTYIERHTTVSCLWNAASKAVR